jgi:hypothetical protein
MIRAIVFLIIGYLAYRVLRRWLRSRSLSGRMTGEAAGRIDDVMIKDPQCGTYFPRRDGVVLKRDEADLLFCSTECRDKYLSARFNPKS